MPEPLLAVIYQGLVLTAAPWKRFGEAGRLPTQTQDAARGAVCTHALSITTKCHFILSETCRGHWMRILYLHELDAQGSISVRTCACQTDPACLCGVCARARATLL